MLKKCKAGGGGALQEADRKAAVIADFNQSYSDVIRVQ